MSLEAGAVELLHASHRHRQRVLQVDLVRVGGSRVADAIRAEHGAVPRSRAKDPRGESGKLRIAILGPLCSETMMRERS
jgi:hypothetical protein